MLEIAVTDKWKKTFPGAHIGTLLLGNVNNTRRPSALDDRKRELGTHIRKKYAGFSRADLLAVNSMLVYRQFYKKFNKTYHVLLQLESVLNKGKSLPSVSPLVDANFAAELETLILSAGHDADRLEPPITIDAATGSEELIQMNGSCKTLKPNDMMMRDARGVACSVIYGQDQRTPISIETRRVLYVAYVPAGIDKAVVLAHLETIKHNVLLFAPNAEIAHLQVYVAGDCA
jgi:DNA/RNA-binding domain of Phe-tRNA-synthetase-like protein